MKVAPCIPRQSLIQKFLLSWLNNEHQIEGQQTGHNAENLQAALQHYFKIGKYFCSDTPSSSTSMFTCTAKGISASSTCFNTLTTWVAQQLVTTKPNTLERLATICCLPKSGRWNALEHMQGACATQSPASLRRPQARLPQLDACAQRARHARAHGRARRRLPLPRLRRQRGRGRIQQVAVQHGRARLAGLPGGPLRLGAWASLRSAFCFSTSMS